MPERNERLGTPFVLTRTFDFGFATGLSYKDVRLCLDEAEALGVPMVAGAAVRQMLAITQAKFGFDSDFTSIAKVVSASKLQDIASFALDLQDMGGVMLDAGLSPMRAAFQEALLAAPGARIAGGTDETLRNIIAERVLGLPADVRVDKELPFDELPTGSAAERPRR